MLSPLPSVRETLRQEQPLFSPRPVPSTPHTRRWKGANWASSSARSEAKEGAAQPGTAPRLHSGKFPGSTRRGIKVGWARGPSRQLGIPPPPAPAMSPPLRLLLLLLAAAALCEGAPLAGELRCRCVQTVSQVIPPRRLARLELLVEGPHCAVPEVIATTKRGQMICLSPAAPWVKLLLNSILRSSHNKL